jgi:hypothetical protein
MNPTLLGVFFIAVDVIVAGYCLYTIATSRRGVQV